MHIIYSKWQILNINEKTSRFNTQQKLQERKGERSNNWYWNLNELPSNLRIQLLDSYMYRIISFVIYPHTQIISLNSSCKFYFHFVNSFPSQLISFKFTTIITSGVQTYSNLKFVEINLLHFCWFPYFSTCKMFFKWWFTFTHSLNTITKTNFPNINLKLHLFKKKQILSRFNVAVNHDSNAKKFYLMK